MRKNTTTAAAVTPITTEVNRSELIRQYKATNPAATNAQIVEALGKDGHKISTTLVGQVLNGRKSKGKGLSVESIQAAAEFCKQYKGKIADAKSAIQSVGGFIETCGNAESALEALTSFEALAAVIK